MLDACRVPGKPLGTGTKARRKLEPGFSCQKSGEKLICSWLQGWHLQNRRLVFNVFGNKRLQNTGYILLFPRKPFPSWVRRQYIESLDSSLALSSLIRENSEVLWFIWHADWMLTFFEPRPEGHETLDKCLSHMNHLFSLILAQTLSEQLVPAPHRGTRLLLGVEYNVASFSLLSMRLNMSVFLPSRRGKHARTGHKETHKSDHVKPVRCHLTR